MCPDQGLPLASNSLMWVRKPPPRRPTRWSPRLRATHGGDSECRCEGERQWASGGHRHCHKMPGQVTAQDAASASGRAGCLEEERRGHLGDELVSCRHCHVHSHARGVNVKRLRRSGVRPMVANRGRGRVTWWHCTVLPNLGIRVPQQWTLWGVTTVTKGRCRNIKCNALLLAPIQLTMRRRPLFSVSTLI